jgi:hypothetical protein
VAGYTTGPLFHDHSEDRVLETCPYLVTVGETIFPNLELGSVAARPDKFHLLMQRQPFQWVQWEIGISKFDYKYLIPPTATASFRLLTLD